MNFTKEELENMARYWNPMGYNELLQEAKEGFFAKADTPLQISTTAAWRAIFGKVAWYWVNFANPAFGALRKVPWDKSGDTLTISEPGTAACQGVAETGTLPDAQIPTSVYHATQFKQVISRFQITRKMQRAAQLGDDVSLDAETLRTWAIKHNALEINKMILENAETYAAATNVAWPGKNGFEALDRIISADGEEDDMGGAGSACFDPWTLYHSTAGSTADWDRDSGTTYDAVVYHADGTLASGNPTFGTDATFTLETVDKIIDDTQKAGADRRFQFFITGYDTARRWAQLISPKQRFDDFKQMSMTVNGVQSVEGRAAGFRVAMYDGIPIIRDHNCPEDGIAKIFLIDSRTLFFKVATPTFLMSPDEAESYLGLDKLVQDNWLLTEGETWCTNVKTQGKIASIK